jgi:hypothetical protein
MSDVGDGLKAAATVTLPRLLLLVGFVGAVIVPVAVPIEHWSLGVLGWGIDLAVGVPCLVLGLLWEATGKVEPKQIVLVLGLFVAFSALLYLILGTEHSWPPGHTAIEVVSHSLITVGLALLAVMIVVWVIPLKRSVDTINSATKNLVDQLAELKGQREQLVSEVEDATRHLLRGFPEIFSKSLQMMREADREIWFVNFIVKFGAPHLFNSEIRESYEKLCDPSWTPASGTHAQRLEDHVGEFFDTLKDKVKRMAHVNILTATRKGAVENFLEPLATWPHYKGLKVAVDQSTAVSSNEAPSDQTFVGQLERAKCDLLRAAQSRESLWTTGADHACRVYQVETLPIQLLIAGRKGTDKTGCLVFMVGEQVLRRFGEGSSPTSSSLAQAVVGFYTELPTFVAVYRNEAEALMSRALLGETRFDGK